MASSSSATAHLGAAARPAADTAEYGWRPRALAVAVAGYAYILTIGIAAAALVPLSAQLAITYKEHTLWPAPHLAVIAATILAYAALMVALSTLRGFFLPRPTLDGIELAPQAATQLRDMIAQLAADLRVCPPKRIFITHDGSSWLSIRTHESGRQAVGIYIGIATLLALPHDELAATLAHELAHLRTRDARLTCFIQRALERWCAYEASFSQRRKFGALPLALVSHWFIAQLAAPLARLCRTDELGADREAARCTSAASLAHALQRLAVESVRAEEVLWPTLERDALAGNPIPDNYCERWLTHLALTDPDDRRIGWHRLALHQQPAETDTHPTLAERIYAIDATPEPTTRCDENATALLGDDWPSIRTHIDRAWKEANCESWTIATERGVELHDRLASHSSDTTLDDMLARALDLEELGDHPAAISLLDELVTKELAFDEARFHLARLLLAQGDDEGIRHMDAVVESDEIFRVAGVCHAIDFMISKGRLDEADAYQCVIEASADAIEEAARERSQLSDEDDFAAHGLESTYVSRLKLLLGSMPQVESAYLVRKQLRYELGDRVYVLAVDAPQRFWWSSINDVAVRELLIEKIVLPGNTEVAILGAWESWLRPHVQRIAGACIYERTKP